MKIDKTNHTLFDTKVQSKRWRHNIDSWFTELTESNKKMMSPVIPNN